MAQTSERERGVCNETPGAEATSGRECGACSETPGAGERECRVCRDSTPPLISPCACSGSLAFVHADCLREWLQAKANRGQFSRYCEVCGALIRSQRGREIDGGAHAPLDVFPKFVWRANTPFGDVIAHYAPRAHAWAQGHQRFWRVLVACCGLLQTLLQIFMVLFCISHSLMHVAGVQLNSTYWPTLVMGDPNGARLLPFTCPDGFVDITYGAPKIWECGAGCMLGPYTDGVCCCACQPAVCISGAYVPDTCVKNNVTCGYIKSYACAPAMWALRLRPGR